MRCVKEKVNFEYLNIVIFVTPVALDYEVVNAVSWLPGLPMDQIPIR